MATLTVQQIAPTGTVPTFVAAAVGGDAFANDGKTTLHVANGSGSTITVSITAQSDCNQGFAHDGGGTVADGLTASFGPFDRQRFNDPETGYVEVTYSAVTTVTVAVTKT